MTQESLQGHTRAHKTSPALPTSKSEQPKNSPRLEETLVELTDADLQAVTGGGGRGGIGGEVDK